MNNVHMLNAERITKSSDLTRKSNAPDWAGLNLGQIPHCTSAYGAKLQSNAGLGEGGGGEAGCGFGID